MNRAELRNERGATMILFAILLPTILILGAAVVNIGNWWTHGRHLQTKVDASVFAGGGVWKFPCGADSDTNATGSGIVDVARQYVGPHTSAAGVVQAGGFNPQIGVAGADEIHVVVNGADWWDDDPSVNPADFTSPAGSVCAATILDVKATEANSPPLFGFLPLWPDVKRKARVEIQEAEGVTGLLPIAVRAPEPVSAAAVFYNEANGNILAVKYFVKNNGIFGIPGGLQGWSSYNSEDSSTWASFLPEPATGVAIAISFRGACNTNLPNPNTKIKTQGAPCFEDAGFSTVNQLCNQGGVTQIVNCYYATGNWPSESVQSGLHFIRGYPTGNAGTGPPQLRSAYLENVSCLVNGVSSPAYFNAHPNNACQAKMWLKVDVGNLTGTYPNPSPPPPNITDNLRASDVQVRYRLVRTDGTTSCNYGANCDLQSSGSGPNLTYSTQGTGVSPHLPLTANSRRNAVAIEIRLRNAQNSSDPDCASASFNANCRWFYTGNGVFGTSVAPTDAQILAAPVQRAFRGNSLTSGSVQWLRLTTDQNCDILPEFIDIEAASQPTGSNRCFFMDMGLKGGVAKDQDEEPILFNDGVGPSQMGSIDCDPNIQQGQILIDGVIQGCGPWYAPNQFNTVPLCPAPNNIFSLPNPGAPWDDWPPLRCIKTRPTGSMNQLERGLDGRLFGNQNANSCPADGPGFVPGRNYWDKDTNQYKGASYADDGPPATGSNLRSDDPRLVTIFLAPTEAFAGSGQITYPITGFISVYIRGYGRISGNGGMNIDDPCPGSAPPSNLDLSGGNTGGYAIWGSIIKHVLPNPSATPSGVICNPGANLQPCVYVLVE